MRVLRGASRHRVLARGRGRHHAFHQPRRTERGQPARDSGRRARSDLTLQTARIRRAAVALMVLVLAALAFEAVLFAFHLAAGSLALTSTVVYDVVVVGAALLCALRALSSRSERLAWALMAVAIALLGDRRDLLRRLSRSGLRAAADPVRRRTSSGCSSTCRRTLSVVLLDPLAPAAALREPVARRR